VSVRVELDPEKRTSGIFRCMRPCPGPAFRRSKRSSGRSRTR